MSRVITFSRTFPAYHPKAGQPTYFVEKIWKGLLPGRENGPWIYMSEYIKTLNLRSEELPTYDEINPKHHTIRSGNRWKVGDKFSPRVWSGKPYKSKQIIIAPDIEVKKVWEFNKYESSKYFFINNRKLTFDSLVEKLAENDGLESHDLLSWFKYPKPFSGQIICWNENINY